MTDKIPSFKEEIDTIHVPIDKLDTIIEKTVQGGAPKRKRSLGKKVVYSAVAAVAAFGLLIGSATVSPAMANIVSQIPIVGSIFSDSWDDGLKRVAEMGLTNVVGESKVMGDTTVTIDEVYYDDIRFTLAYSFATEKSFGDETFPSPTLSIDGEIIGMSHGKGIDNSSPTYQTQELSFTPTDLPKEFDLEVTFEQKDGETVKFIIPVSSQTTSEFVQINEKLESDLFTIVLSNLEFTEGGMLLSYGTTIQDSRKADFLLMDLEFKIVDEFGKEYVSTRSSGSGMARNGIRNSTDQLLFHPVDDQVKELTITPYLDVQRYNTDSDGTKVPIDHPAYEESDYEKIDNIKFDSVTVKLP